MYRYRHYIVGFLLQLSVKNLSKDNPSKFKNLTQFKSLTCYNFHFLWGPQEGHSDLLDWVIVSSYSKLSEALINKFQDFFEFEDFELNQRTQSIENKKYNIIWHHLFDGLDKSKINQIDQLRLKYSTIKEKILYLINKFNNSSQTNTLYIIADRIGLNKEEIIMLRNAIIRNRNGNKNFIILNITNIRKFENFDNIITADQFQMKGHWEGGDINDTIRWKEILDQFKFAPDIWE